MCCIASRLRKSEVKESQDYIRWLSNNNDGRIFANVKILHACQLVSNISPFAPMHTPEEIAFWELGMNGPWSVGLRERRKRNRRLVSLWSIDTGIP